MPVERMIFFGSHARGRARKWSDVDLIVVSRHFRGKRFRYRPLGFHRLWDIRYPVDFLCYTPEEFRKLRTIVNGRVSFGLALRSFGSCPERTFAPASAMCSVRLRIPLFL
ncbi:MAG: nucleotidyltransferase domain-containing protein [Candidatus Tectomicrobia bacterium]|nr:nucleotidyltransferase domain-containing protein [Candidatus Tectomicrobia bacterium]